jgi:uncharacterized protein involved in exopolysaccharide biosynthesis
MARARSTGNGRLEEALAALTRTVATLMQSQATLTQNQAAFLARAAETDARIAQIDARMAEMDRINTERFARIEALLLEHNRILQALPDAIRDKIGFKPPAP